MRRRDFVRACLSAGVIEALGLDSAGAQECVAGGVLPEWRPGELELHFIYTGCGENMFYRLPDGTAILNDTGEFCRRSERAKVPLLPSANRLGGDWVARYVRRVYSGRDIDYLLVSHWHSDHVGHAVFDGDGKRDGEPDGDFRYRTTADGRKVNGLLCVAEAFRFGCYLDNEFPHYGRYGSEDSSLELLRPWLTAERGRGLVVEPFRVGALNQISLRRSPSEYPDFSVRNICANGCLWDGRDGFRDYAAEHVAATGRRTVSQNVLSMGFLLRYGKFSYFNGGDVSQRLVAKTGEKVDYEECVGERVGPVTVCKMNHHGFLDAMRNGFVRKVPARIYTTGSWCPSHAHPEVLGRIASSAAERGLPLPLLVPTLVTREQRRQAETNGWRLSPEGACHVVVKVPPGGETWRVHLVDARDESMRVVLVYEGVS